MAIGTSYTALSRRAKQGSYPTAGQSVPAADTAIGAVHDPRSAAPDAASSASQPDPDMLDFLSASGAMAMGVPEQASVADQAKTAQEAAGTLDVPSSLPPRSPFAALAAARGASDDDADAPAARTYVDPGGPFSDLVKPGQEATTTAARRDVHAIKVVSRLVRAIAFKPGTAADRQVKSAELQAMLLDVDRAAREVMLAAAPLDAHRGWVRALCTESVAELVAARHEGDAFNEPVNLDDAIRAVKDVFARADENQALDGALAAMKESSYEPATSEAVAQDRVRVSFGLACWELYDFVMHPRLGTQTFRYTYERRPEEIVARLADEALKLAREMNMRIASLDMRTAHLQGSLRRIAQLMGAEYVNRTRQIMNWIGEASTDDEYQGRLRQAHKAFDQHVVAEVVELARRNFVAIEQLAPKLLEDVHHANEHTQRQGT